jgi:hypothetical protein
MEHKCNDYIIFHTIWSVLRVKLEETGSFTERTGLSQATLGKYMCTSEGG